MTREDDPLIEGFEQATLQTFGHVEHVRVAWIYLSRLPLNQAAQKVVDGLMRLTRALGASQKFHATITWAYVLLIHERRAALPPNHDWATFASANPDLLCAKPSILHAYYRPKTLASDFARSTFVLPDRGLPARPPSGIGPPR